jgi:para-nitrobenzyl esterase
MAMPKAQGLFHKAIIQSASSLLRMATQEAAERNTHFFLQELNLAPGDLATLHATSPERLLKAMPAAVLRAGNVDNYRPAVDMRSLASHPFDQTAPALSAQVPLMIGWCETELRFAYSLTPEIYTMSDADAHARVARLIGIDAAEAKSLLDVYRNTRPMDSPGDLFALIQ